MTLSNVTLDGISLGAFVPEALVLDVVRPLLGARRDVSLEVPGRAGSVTFSEQPGDAELELVVHLLGDSLAARRAAFRELAQWADTPAGPVRLIVDDEADRYYDALLSRTDVIAEELNYAELGLVYRVGPFAWAVSTSSYSVTATGGSPATGTVTFADEVEAFPVLEVTPLNGTLTSLEVTIAGRTLVWSGSVASGNTLTISSPAFVVYLGQSTDTNVTGAYDPATVDMADVSGDFPILEPGDTDYTLTYTGTATSLELVFTWRRRYY